MVTIFDTSSTHTNIDIVGLCMYTSKNIWLEKEKYLVRQKETSISVEVNIDGKGQYKN